MTKQRSTTTTDINTDSSIVYDGMLLADFWPRYEQILRDNPDWAAVVQELHTASYNKHPAMLFTKHAFGSLSAGTRAIADTLEALARRFPAGLPRIIDGKEGPTIGLIDPEKFDAKTGRNFMRPAYDRLNTKEKIAFRRWRKGHQTAVHDPRWYAAAFCWLFKNTSGAGANFVVMIRKMSTEEWLTLLPSLHNQILMIMEVQKLERSASGLTPTELQLSIRRTVYQVGDFGIMKTAALRLPERFSDMDSMAMAAAGTQSTFSVQETESTTEPHARSNLSSADNLEVQALLACAHLLLDQIPDIPDLLQGRRADQKILDPQKFARADRVLTQFLLELDQKLTLAQRAFLVAVLVQVKELYSDRNGPSLVQIMGMIHALQILPPAEE